MTILEIYKQYKIMPQLEEHQLRVAGVTSLILDNITPRPPLTLRGGVEDKQDIITACLLHDMGNIIKFDFSQTHKIVNYNLNFSYWKAVQTEFQEKYGVNEHNAHVQIAREIGVNDRVIELIEAISFLGAPQNASGKDFGKKICQYADDRVSPFGVVSLEERLLDLRQRYAHYIGDEAVKINFETALRQIERQIFTYCKIRPNDITEELVKQKLNVLKKWEI